MYAWASGKFGAFLSFTLLRSNVALQIKSLNCKGHWNDRNIKTALVKVGGDFHCQYFWELLCCFLNASECCSMKSGIVTSFSGLGSMWRNCIARNECCSIAFEQHYCQHIELGTPGTQKLTFFLLQCLTLWLYTLAFKLTSKDAGSCHVPASSLYLQGIVGS